MSDSHLPSEISGGGDLKTIERSLETLWEKARRISDVIMRLRGENEALKDQVRGLSTNNQSLQGELERSRQELGQVKQQLLQIQSNGSDLYSKEEKEALKARIKELIVKINSRL